MPGLVRSPDRTLECGAARDRLRVPGLAELAIDFGNFAVKLPVLGRIGVAPQ